MRTKSSNSARGFTITDLLAILAVLAMLFAMLLPALADTTSKSKVFQCLNNLRQLTRAWTMYSTDNREAILGCPSTISVGKISWMTGTMDFSPGNRSNWDTNQDLAKSPLWAYAGGDPALFKCAADKSAVLLAGRKVPRVRSVSMNSAFGSGDWLDRAFNPNQRIWRTYTKRTEIVIPGKTFVFMEEHPDSINDPIFSSACTGNQPGDLPSEAKIIDLPGLFHEGRRCAVSFADGRVECHNWMGIKIRPPMNYDNRIPLNVPADDSWMDTHWIAENTTVRR